MGVKSRILIVDDNEGTCRSLTLILRKKAYETVTAGTGREALEKVRESPFDVVLLDVKLPDMSSVELIPQLKTVHPEIALIVITAYASLETAASALNDGAMLYLMKPLNADIVLAKVEEALNEQTVRRKNEQDVEELGERAEKFRMMAEIGRDIVYQCDLHGTITYCSRSVERVLQFTQEEMIGTNFSRYLSPSELTKATEAFQKIRSGENVEQLEIGITRKDGAVVPLEINTVPIIKDGSIVGTQGMGRDITSRKEAEGNIQRRDAILEAVSYSALRLMKTISWKEQIPDILGRLGVAADVCRVYIFENHSENEELLTSQCFEWVREGIPPQIDNPDLQGFSYLAGGFHRWAREMTRGGIIQGHVRDFPEREREDLEQHDIKSIITVPVFVGNSWWGFIGFDACIAEHRWSTAEQDALKIAGGMIGAAIERGLLQRDADERRDLLRESEERWRAAVEESPDFVILVDTDLNVSYLNYASPGLKVEDYVGTKVYSHHPKEEQQKAIERYKSVLKTGETVAHESSYQKPDGGIMHYESRIASRTVNGKVIGLTIITRDITVRKTIEEELRNSQIQLQNLTAHLQTIREEERTRIAREIHDELGQTMTALKMDVAWLSKKLPEGDRSLNGKLESMTSLIESNLQTVKRISAELRPGLLDDLGIVAAVEWQAGDFESRFGVRCEVSFDPEDIEIDKERSTAIFRVLQEALTNVARHADATLVEVRLVKEADKYILSVGDNGNGIDEKKVSNPQALGLVGMRERIRPWEGFVEIKGNKRGGTRVTVTIPHEKEKS